MPLDSQVEHLREQGQNPVCLVGMFAKIGVQGLDLPPAHSSDLLRSELPRGDQGGS
jgi:hypothetical protein